MILAAIARVADFLGILDHGPPTHRHKSLAAFEHELRERTDWSICDLVTARNVDEVMGAVRSTPTRGKRLKRWDGLTSRIVGMSIEQQGRGCFRVTYDVAPDCVPDLCEQQASTG